MNELLLRRELLAANAISGAVLPANGVYILGVDNKFYTESTWNQPNNNAAGIAVITDEAKFVIDIYTKVSSKTYQWYHTHSTTVFNNVGWNTDDKSVVLADLKGIEHNEDIIKLVGEEAAAIFYCVNYNAKGLKWYLPTVGEWKIVFNNFSNINKLMLKIGGIKLDTPNGGFYGAWFNTCNLSSDGTYSWRIFVSDSSFDTDHISSIDSTGYDIIPFASLPDIYL